MKRRNLFVISCMVFILLSSVGFASDDTNKQGPYVGGRIGACLLNDATLSASGYGTADVEFDTGMALELGFGYDFGMFRAEGEIGYRKNDLDKVTVPGESGEVNGDVDSLSFMINGYFDIENSTPFTPYIGAGIGFAKISTNDIGSPEADVDLDDEDDTVFAYQLGVGVGFSVTQSLIIDLAYKYFATSDPEFGIVEAEYSSHNISLGIRYSF